MDRDRYKDATAKLRDLKSHLPEGAVKSLAQEVIRRSAHTAATKPDLVAERAQPKDIEILTDCLVGSDPDAALRFIEELQARGTVLEDIYLIYLSSAGQRLGRLWEANALSLAEVALGTSRIYGILRAIEPLQPDTGPPRPQSAIFANVPGDHHVLGIRIAADIFRQRGWDIELLLGLSHDELVARVHDTAHLIIGLSVGSESMIAALARLVVAIRLHKPGVRIFVGGQAVAEYEDLVAAVSPDAMSANFEHSYDLMMELWRDATQGSEEDLQAYSGTRKI